MAMHYTCKKRPLSGQKINFPTLYSQLQLKISCCYKKTFPFLQTDTENRETNPQIEVWQVKRGAGRLNSCRCHFMAHLRHAAETGKCPQPHHCYKHWYDNSKQRMGTRGRDSIRSTSTLTITRFALVEVFVV